MVNTSEVIRFTGSTELYLDSREVATMVNVEHSDLLKKMVKISNDLRKGDFTVSEYWIKSTYKVEGNNKTYKNYLLTKSGCEFIANKTTGAKGNLFTALYIKKFREMEQVINKPTLPTTYIEALKELVASEEKKEQLALENKELNETIEINKPKVETYDKFVEKEHTLGFRELRQELECAYNITIKEKDLKKFLRDKKILSKATKMTPLANGTRNGFAVVKDIVSNNGYTITQTRFTMKTRDLITKDLDENLGQVIYTKKIKGE